MRSSNASSINPAWCKRWLVPRRARPRLPEEWHVPNNPKEWITWKRANKKLTIEKVYWISTASTEGKPHAAPVWGIWKNSSFYFETDPNSPKGRNLVKNPRIVFHIQDGMDTHQIVFKEKPRIAHAWKAPRMHRSLVNFIF